MRSSPVDLAKRIERLVHATLRWLAMGLLLALCASMALQVFQRFVVGRSLDWPDELAPTLLAWIGFVGATLAARDNEHVSFPLLVEALPPALAHMLKVLGTLVVVALLSVYAWFSIPLIARTLEQTLTTVEISRGLLYLVLPLTSLVMIGYALSHSPIGEWLRRRRDDTAPSSDSETLGGRP